MRAFLARPDIQAMIKPANFTVAATVETSVSLLDAGSAYNLSDNLEGRWFRSIRARDGRVLWLFESVDDAILFGLKFAGLLGSSISVAEWQSSRD